ncbi:hypothetical protein [Sphingosinicella sp. YJ22]|uniref:hypothetical protein n=1 Tax=Sphingosinicella sp. YJ22 TaxID=1104780 RepID=UPI0014099983|nr:hypothetical protein [Sphingosinicella sp. YJ22]
MNEVDERTWRNRFILINLAQIGGTVVVLLALLLWQTNVFVAGGHWIGFPIALVGLAASFLAPRMLARRWKRPPGS